MRDLREDNTCIAFGDFCRFCKDSTSIKKVSVSQGIKDSQWAPGMGEKVQTIEKGQDCKKSKVMIRQGKRDRTETKSVNQEKLP